MNIILRRSKSKFLLNIPRRRAYYSLRLRTYMGSPFNVFWPGSFPRNYSRSTFHIVDMVDQSLLESDNWRKPPDSLSHEDLLRFLSIGDNFLQGVYNNVVIVFESYHHVYYWAIRICWVFLAKVITLSKAYTLTWLLFSEVIVLHQSWILNGAGLPLHKANRF
jgi:hypothetical protein